MGTRCIIEFKQGRERIQIYRHWDGYLSGVIPDIEEFLIWNGDRNKDLSYAAANFIVWSKVDGCIHRCEMNKKDKDKGRDPKYYPKTLLEAFNKPDPNMGNLHTGFGIESRPHTEEDLKENVFIEFFYRIELFESGNISVKGYANGSKGLKKLVEFTFWEKQQRLINYGEGTDSKKTCEQVIKVIEK